MTTTADDRRRERERERKRRWRDAQSASVGGTDAEMGDASRLIEGAIERAPKRSPRKRRDG
jgi:hypothetical protein